MNYMQIKPVDIANGEGVRTSIWVSGCNRHCPGCFNPETWDFDAGQECNADTLHELVEHLKPDYIAGLTVLGGEPLEPANIEEVAYICWYIKHVYPKKTIWLYTGYTIEALEVMFVADRIGYGNDLHDVLMNIDVLVDGAYIEAENDLKLQFRGSRNQRIIDVKEMLKGESFCPLWKGDKYSRGAGLGTTETREYVQKGMRKG